MILRELLLINLGFCFRSKSGSGRWAGIAPSLTSVVQYLCCVCFCCLPSDCSLLAWTSFPQRISQCNNVNQDLIGPHITFLTGKNRKKKVTKSLQDQIRVQSLSGAKRLQNKMLVSRKQTAQIDSAGRTDIQDGKHLHFRSYGMYKTKQLITGSSYKNFKTQVYIYLCITMDKHRSASHS